MKEGMKGLTNFIADIRSCKSPEAELKRINKELANIRSKFGEKKQLDGYNKKKYACKLLFIFLLGHDVEFGYMESVNLLSSLKFSEKQMGYLFVQVMMNEAHELAKLVIKAIQHDLASRNELHVCVALNCIGNFGGKETLLGTIDPVRKLLVATEAPNTVKKKAALCMLHFMRTAPDDFSLGDSTNAMMQLLTNPDLGVVTAVSSLLIDLAEANAEAFRPVVQIAVNRLHRIVHGQETQGYNYYQIPAPWLTVKLLRLLQYFDAPSDHAVATRLKETLRVILQRTSETSLDKSKKRKDQMLSSVNACFFEAVRLIVHLDDDQAMQTTAIDYLGEFLRHKAPNLKFLALESLGAMALTSLSRDTVKRHQETVVRMLNQEKEPTVQRRAVDFLYAVCDSNSVTTIVEELLSFLAKADYSLREELVLRVAILSERYCTDYQWYVDVILKLIKTAGDFVAEEVWHRVIQIIINRQDVQDYASKICFEALLDPAAHDAMICVGGYVLGEFGHLIANDPVSSPAKQFDVLQSHYPMVRLETRCLLLSTYVKFANLFPEIKPAVEKVLRNPNYIANSDSEIQQRANEYLQLINVPSEQVLPAVLEEMPPFPEAESHILAKLQSKTGGVGKKRASKTLSAVSAADHHENTQSAGPTTVTNDAFFPKFLLSNSGVLYENPVMQIGAKCVFTKNRGCITLFYGNRGQSAMTEVRTRAYVPKDTASIAVEARPIDSIISPGAQVQQMIDVECIGCFSSPPMLDLNLNYEGRQVTVSLKLPVHINKFLNAVPSGLSAEQFMQKWNALGGPPREVQHTKQSAEPASADAAVAKLVSFGFPVLPGVDPSPSNVVAAAILHTTQAQVGLLLRVEASGQSYRFTLRTSSNVVSNVVCPLLAEQF
eukprot:m.73468 g.73468  ORF g.73468 m.73468 type:complete len:888 (+) comp14353_c0_seq1:289-2952(+)